MNHNFNIYKLHFNSPLHISNEREDYAESLQTIHSDTFYAALTSVLAATGYNFEKDFNGNLGFNISGLFPFYQKKKDDGKASYFFPKPFANEQFTEANLHLHKHLKGIKWLDKSFFQLYLNGKSIEEIFVNNKDTAHAQGAFLATKELEKNFMTTQIFPRVKVPRIGNEDAKPFYMEKILFSDNSGLFFIAQGNTLLLEQALNVLQHQGIGTDRNVGNGFFEWSKDSIELNLPDKSDYAINLSAYLPENKNELESMLNENSAYNLLKRGGWITTPPYNSLRKNRIHMFAEGSVFKLNIEKIKILGRIANLTPNIENNKKPDHNIFRYGIAMFIPLIINQ